MPTFPPLLTHSTIWRDGDGAEWVVTLDLDEVGDAIEATRIEVTYAGRTPRPVNTKVMRAIPYRSLIEDARARKERRIERGLLDRRTPRQVAEEVRKATRVLLAGVALAEELPSPEDLPDDATVNERAAVLAAKWATEGKGRGRPRTRGADHWAAVATVYTRAETDKRAAVAEHFSVSATTAAAWVKECRKLGFIPPTGRARTKESN